MVNRQSLLKRKVSGENIQGEVTEGLEMADKSDLTSPKDTQEMSKGFEE